MIRLVARRVGDQVEQVPGEMTIPPTLALRRFTGRGRTVSGVGGRQWEAPAALHGAGSPGERRSQITFAAALPRVRGQGNVIFRRASSSGESAESELDMRLVKSRGHCRPLGPCEERPWHRSRTLG
ncbi:MAG TPA: hypothetical protein VHT91_31215 [Kofleriaceae bacterium]|nr:hypothetical protein [Kofleriaceae bacterium]